MKKICQYCITEECTKPLKRKMISVLYQDIMIESFLIGEDIVFTAGNDYDIIMRAKIKYCPICGRRLKNDSE